MLITERCVLGLMAAEASAKAKSPWNVGKFPFTEIHRRLFLGTFPFSTHLESVHRWYHHDKVVGEKTLPSVQLSLPPALILSFLKKKKDTFLKKK